MVGIGWSDWAQTWVPLVLSSLALLISLGLALRTIGRERRAHADLVFVSIDSWTPRLDERHGAPVPKPAEVLLHVQNDSAMPVLNARVRVLNWAWRSGDVIAERAYHPIDPRTSAEAVHIDLDDLGDPPGLWDLPPVDLVFTIAGRRWKRTPDSQLWWWAGGPLERWVRCWPHVNEEQSLAWERKRSAERAAARRP